MQAVENKPGSETMSLTQCFRRRAGWFSGLADTIFNSRPGSARVSRVGFGVSPKRTLLLRPIYLSRRSLGVGRTLQPFNLVTLLTNHIAEPTRGDLFTVLRISLDR